MSGPLDITKAEAAEALRAAAFQVTDLDSVDYGRRLIHTYRGPFGADWDLDDAIEAVAGAQRIAWVDTLTGHDLGLIDAEGKTVFFNVQRPEAEL